MPLEKGDYLINSGHTLIVQSKVMFAFLYEIIGKGIITQDEEKFIKKYIPYTSMEKDKSMSKDYVIKPYLSREGQGIKMNYETLNESEMHEAVYQERVNIKPLRYGLEGQDRFMFPVIGTYITGSEFAGIYTRIGNIVTDKEAVYIPTYITEE